MQSEIAERGYVRIVLSVAKRVDEYVKVSASYAISGGLIQSGQFLLESRRRRY